MSYFKSWAQWPVGTPGTDSDGFTSDRHDTRGQALSVCRMLRLQGYGGERNIYPVRVFIEEIKGEDEP